MKVVIFGIGKFYQRRKGELLSDTEIELIAIVDNNVEIQGTYIDGIPVFAVEQSITLDFDIILLMSRRANEMKLQLSKLGVDTNRIWYWRRFKSEKERGKFHFYCGDLISTSVKKKILIISTDLGYTGGALAAVYAAKALQKRNYFVVLAAPNGDPVFINEMKSNGLNLMICSALPYLYQEEFAFVEQFDAVIVNVFPMILCASEISKRKPVVWWIHEASDFYDANLIEFSEYANKERLSNIDIYGVSRIAQENFNHHFFNRITNTLAYGIPDEYQLPVEKNMKDRIVFAIIGGVTYRKAQDIFLEAVKEMRKEVKNEASFWIIGSFGQDSYSIRIKELALQEPSVSLLGEMTREEIRKAFSDIDVLVCPSREDPLPIVVTEAMMHGKVCIVSDSIGMVDYIVEGENGFMFKNDNIHSFSEKMDWVIRNRDKLMQIGQNARETYEKYFTLDCFGERLEKILQNL